MLSGRALAIAVAVAAVLWFSLDSGLVRSEPPLPGTSVALGMLAVAFGAAAWVMQQGGQPQRVPLLVGMALGVGGYALIRTVAS